MRMSFAGGDGGETRTVTTPLLTGDRDVAAGCDPGGVQVFLKHGCRFDFAPQEAAAFSAAISTALVKWFLAHGPEAGAPRKRSVFLPGY